MLPLHQRFKWPSFGTSERGVEGSVWRRRCDSNTQALSGDGFLDRAATVTVYIGIKQGPWFGSPAVNNEVTNPGPPGPPYLAGTDVRIPWTHAM